jgi:predicted DCC family thiol-disulfide oxidoreductase YuxK
MTSSQSSDVPFDVEVFFDGACPLCRREIGMLRRLDRRERIRFTDIAAAGFDPAGVGRTQDALMAEIHGRLPDGTLIRGVEVFRRLYAAVGFGPLVWLTRLPGLSQLLDVGYTLFARHRLKLTGRCTAETCAIESPAQVPVEGLAATVVSRRS